MSLASGMSSIYIEAFLNSKACSLLYIFIILSIDVNCAASRENVSTGWSRRTLKMCEYTCTCITRHDNTSQVLAIYMYHFYI